MARWRLPRALVPVLVIALLALAPINASAQTKRDVNRAEAARDNAYAELQAANDELEDALHELEAVNGELYQLNDRINTLGNRIIEYEAESDQLWSKARDLVVSAYINGGQDLMFSALQATSIQDLLTSQVLIDRAASFDLAALGRFDAVSREMDRLTAELDDDEDAVDWLQQRQTVVARRLDEAQTRANQVFANADANYKDVKARFIAAERRKAALAAARRSGAAKGLPASVTTGNVCPVAGGGWFIDSWGAPRSGGRSHKGVDISAARGTPLLAMNSGSVRLGSHYLGGRQTYLYGDNGLMYYYAHLSGWPGGLATGARVVKGQIIGYLGDSGNARGHPHLHLGIAPIGGSFVNPYPTARAAC